jgi:hypothetical protein
MAAADLKAARTALTRLEPEVTRAADRVRAATVQRDQALAWAAVDAARSRASAFLDKLNEALVDQAMLEGLAQELTTRGNVVGATAAFLQASSAISDLTATTRRAAAAQPNADAARRLLAALATNPEALLE